MGPEAAIMAEATAQHEWITFKRVHGYDEDHHTPEEVDARWCGRCGTLDLGETDQVGRFFTTSGVRQAEPACIGR